MTKAKEIKDKDIPVRQFEIEVKKEKDNELDIEKNENCAYMYEKAVQIPIEFFFYDFRALL